MIVTFALIYAASSLPWFVERYSDEWNNEIAINGNLAYDLINGKLQNPFIYPHKVHILGPSVFGFLVAPLYALFKPYYFLIGLVELMIAVMSFIIWIIICKKIDIKLAILFGIYAVLAPPMFKWQSTYAWATHPESVMLQGLNLLLFISLLQKEFKSKFNTLMLGFVSGFAVFFLIGNLTMVISILFAWVIARRKKLFIKLPYFIAGFLIGIFPLILRLTFYGDFSEFSAWYISPFKELPLWRIVKEDVALLLKTLVAFADSPMFHIKAKSIIYVLTALLGYIALLFKIKENRALLPVVFYPIIFFLMLSFSKLGRFIGIPTVRYFLPLYPVCFFVISYLVLSAYKRSKVIGITLGVLIAIGIVWKEPAYPHHLKRLLNFESGDFIKLKMYKGYERHMFWALTVPEFVQRTRTSYLNYAKNAHDWEMWLVCSELARWTYLQEKPDDLDRAFEFAESKGCERYFMQGLGVGVVENIFMWIDSRENSITEKIFMAEWSISFYAETFERDIRINVDKELLERGKVVGIAGILAGHNYIPTDLYKPALERSIDKIRLDDTQKLEALIEGYMLSKISVGSPEPREVECFLNKGCKELNWIYERITNEDDYYYAVGKALAYVYALRNFYIPEEILKDARVKRGLVEKLKELGFVLGESKKGVVEILYQRNDNSN